MCARLHAGTTLCDALRGCVVRETAANKAEGASCDLDNNMCTPDVCEREWGLRYCCVFIAVLASVRIMHSHAVYSNSKLWTFLRTCVHGVCVCVHHHDLCILLPLKR